MTLVQRPAPEFSAEAILPDGSDGTVALSDLRGRYAVLLFWPLDFTFVCPTEVIAFSDRFADFARRDASVVGISVDSVHVHRAWRATERTAGGIGQVAYPLVSDLDRVIARSYGVLLERPEVALRATVIIDRQGIVRSVLAHDLPLGRSVDEILRLLDALAHTERFGEVCPADWRAGAATFAATPDGIRAYAAARYAA